ncbi:hypothetical protein J2I47_19025 [Fibrella sp. HMF5335]|uniref:Uncharacterized protein n=1 Tax=Fibrella rubiginis TaxID=2817060 RepID=A0A939GGD3_9BACT|nr:hypothetical protein [Fibrella rubiginis]MBO0938652.1 hypothetical protein [Fibrella rubiginis]
MESVRLLQTTGHDATATAPSKRHKADGAATAALLIQLASEMLETSPTLRKRLGVTLSDLMAADKVRKALIRQALPA